MNEMTLQRAPGVSRADENAIMLQKVNKWFGEFHVLRDVSVEVAHREVVVVIGPSGSGKSTFIRCINRLEEHKRERSSSMASN